MLRKTVYRKRKKKHTFYILLFVSMLLFIYFDSILRPQVISLSRYRVQGIITSIANKTIVEEMSQRDREYTDLVTIRQNEKGDVTFLSYNAIEVNKLKAELTAALIKNLGNIQQTKISIPLANILGIDLLRNRGPTLNFNVVPVAYVETDIESRFENTGINQVSHKIYIVLKIDAAALVPNFSSNVNFETRICIAQTVIIGSVPKNISDKLIQIPE